MSPSEGDTKVVHGVRRVWHHGRWVIDDVQPPLEEPRPGLLDEDAERGIGQGGEAGPSR